MNDHSSATRNSSPLIPARVPAPPLCSQEDESPDAASRSTPRSGIAWGLLGVVAFSFTVPLTTVALGGLSPLFVASARAVVAGALAIVALSATRQRRPSLPQWLRLGAVALGVVVGFPLLTSLALTTSTASHGAVIIALLPAATAMAVVVRTGERPGTAFWVAAALGALAAVVFAALQTDSSWQLSWHDLLLFGAVTTAAIGYAEGGLLARELGAWQTISWALVLSLPLMLALATVSVLTTPPHATPIQWAAFSYLGVVSMFLGFFAWYRGLEIGPMAKVSQVQLTQPVMSIAWAALLLGEPLTLATVGGGLAVVACAALAVRSRITERKQG
ncbi:DMT family transporter [Leucobacter aridicollis]|uniref:DMT family transporter n=1 Tax=Leucobacter aridicollis TaxID=283878 RepID=UPI0021060706|nr:DMT family transporter [Leucobacter aridicollis]UTX53931.1 DMT family transporter [Leucobacter aridicollis]